VTFSPLAWEKFCDQALAAPVQQESVWLCRSTKRTETGMYKAWQVCSWTEAESHFDKKPNYEYKQFYTTPPAAQLAVPDILTTKDGEHPEYVSGWNDCRAETLRKSKP
jgi:hypothetical protein